MSQLDKLIYKINSFCNESLLSLLLVKRAAPPMGTYVSPPDEDEEDIPEPTAGEDVGKYNELLHVASQVRDPGLASELTLLAELYRKAIAINGGYNSINRSIHNIINMYLEDEEDPQQEEIEDILNEVVSDLRKRAGGGAGLSKPDSPEAIKALKEMKDNFNTQNLQQEVYDLSNYEESATSTFDPTGGVGKEEAGKGFGRGHSFTTRKSLKDWISHYENEKQRYTDLLSSVSNISIQDKIKNLVDVLDKLKTGVAEENKLMEAFSTTGDETIGNQLAKLKEDNKKLKASRVALKQSIKNTEINRSVAALEEQMRGAKDDRTKERLKQEMELLKLVSSKDIGKTEERNWRRLLIKSMSGGNWPSNETRQKLEKNIQDAAAKKKSYEQYQKELAEKIKQQFHYVGKTRLRPLSVEGLHTEFKQSVASIKMGIKKKVTEAARLEENTRYKPYKDRIAAAYAAKDLAAQKEAEKDLQKALNKDAESHPAVLSFVRYSENFYTFIKALELVNVSENKNEAIPESTIDELIQTAQYLIQQERVRKKPGSKPARLELALVDIEKELKERSSGDTEDKPIVRGYMNTKQRKIALQQILKESLLDETKLKQLTQNTEAQNYAHEVFEKLLSELKIPNIDD